MSKIDGTGTMVVTKRIPVPLQGPSLICMQRKPQRQASSENQNGSFPPLWSTCAKYRT